MQLMGKRIIHIITLCDQNKKKMSGLHISFVHSATCSASTHGDTHNYLVKSKLCDLRWSALRCKCGSDCCHGHLTQTVFIKKMLNCLCVTANILLTEAALKET